MNETFEVIAEARSDTGKGASRRLRRTGKVPGIVYGAHQEPQMIQVQHNELLQHLDHEPFYSHILNLKVDGSGQQVILKDLQRHPAKPFVLHIDFQRVSADEKLKTHVPLHFLNEETCVGVKHGGLVSHHLTDIEITCLPRDLPEYIEVDLADVDIGGIIHLSEVKVPAGVEILALLQGEDHDVPVTSVHGKPGGDEEETEEEGAA